MESGASDIAQARDEDVRSVTLLLLFSPGRPLSPAASLFSRFTLTLDLSGAIKSIASLVAIGGERTGM